MAYLHRVFSFLCLIKDGFHRFYIGKSLFSRGKKVCEKHVVGGKSNNHWEDYMFGCPGLTVLDLSAVFMWDSLSSKKFMVP